MFANLKPDNQLNPDLPLVNPLQKLGSSIELELRLTADKGLYTIQAFRNSDLATIVASDRDFTHNGGTVNKFLKVPLVEGANDFFLRVFETSTAGGTATTSTVPLAMNRDLEFGVSSVRLNHIEISGQQVPLYTREPRVTVFFTLSGNSSSMEVAILVNGNQVATTQENGSGSFSEPGILLQSDTLNLIQLRARSLDTNGQALGFVAESNILRVFHDDNPPVIPNGGLSTTFQNTPPAAGTPWR